MMRIPYEVLNFSSALQNGQGELSVTWYDLAWAAVTVGRAPLRQRMPYRFLSLLDALSRVANLRATLQVAPHGYLLKTDLYEAMDATEKGFASYSHGMMLAKLFASRLMGVHWLTHLTSIYSPPVTFVCHSRLRPDLIGWGLNNGTYEFSVFEAKGRSGVFDAKALTHAKAQTKSIRTINGVPPVIKVATESSYCSGRLRMTLEDPEEFSKDALDVKFSSQDFFRAYYSNITILKEKDPFITEKLGVEFRLDKQVSVAMDTGNYAILSRLEVETALQQDDGWVLFPDGVHVRLNPRIWNTEVKDPS